MNKGCLEIQFLIKILIVIQDQKNRFMSNWKPLASQFLYSDVIHSSKKGKHITGLSFKPNFVIIKINNLYAALC